MIKRLLSLQNHRFHDEKGYILFFSLFILGITTLFSAVLLWVGESLEQRVTTRIAILQAQGLVHEGVERIVFGLRQQSTVMQIHVVKDLGTVDAACHSTSDSSPVWQIDAAASTYTGAKATATVYFDARSKSILRWSESP